MVVRGTTAATSPSMTTRKWLFSQITVAVLPAWIIPAWIFHARCGTLSGSCVLTAVPLFGLGKDALPYTWPDVIAATAGYRAARSMNVTGGHVPACAAPGSPKTRRASKEVMGRLRGSG